MILAIDPGITTGMAWFNTAGNNKYGTIAVKSNEAVYGMILSEKWDKVIYEDFNAVHISAPGLATVRLIGGIIALCWEHQLETVRQMPRYRAYQQASAHLMLKTKKHMIHEEDALAHLLAYQANMSVLQRSRSPSAGTRLAGKLRPQTTKNSR